MTRTALPYSAPDLSALARLLERAILDHHTTHGRLPGHVEMMNLLARGAGKRNLQELKAQAERTAAPARSAEVAAPVATPEPSAAEPDRWFDAPELLDPATTSPAERTPPALSDRAAKTLQCFDFSGRLARWPLKRSQQRLAMWILWMRFDARRVYTEAEFNRVLKAWHTYGDHATLRRELIDHRLMARKDDCSEYRKLPQSPDDEVRGLMHALRTRQAPHRLSRRPPRELPPVAAAPSSQAREQ